MKSIILKSAFSFFILLKITTNIYPEDGYKLWLRYAPIQENAEKVSLTKLLNHISIHNESPTFKVIRDEMIRGCEGMLGFTPEFSGTVNQETGLIIETSDSQVWILPEDIRNKKASLGREGYLIDRVELSKKERIIIVANTPAGALYGVFHLLREIQAGNYPFVLPVSQYPEISHRLLNHWDNLDRTVERGYAGFSIWDWHRLPMYIDQRYIDYARANASIGINSTVLTNVNANAWVLTPQYVEKVAALADVFRPYGIKVYLTARFSSPIEIGGLKTADPLILEVRQWWKAKVDEIYKQIPDFGGFLVKANSEGQPGPQNYGRSHADGANMLAEALAPHGGIVMWRAFVYSHEVPEDRAKQANNEFEPLDGQFRDNVFIQVKNGAIDFQPREPFHPLFGAMPETALALELQITQEYLGQGTSLAYLAPLFKECLESKTYVPEKNSTVATIVDGTAYGRSNSAMAGVSNIGNDRNWTGHLFGQSNWYAFGRLAWNHELSSEEIANEWIRLTFGNDPVLLETIKQIMLMSREAVVNYMTPLGLHHIMGRNHHYGPGPWIEGGRPDWTSVYYHRADEKGIGFDRTSSGSDALNQYAPEIQELYSNPKTCPDKYLLWFHHLPWDFEMKSGNTLWEKICLHYDHGVKSVRDMNKLWQSIEGKTDAERFRQVESLLRIQEKEAEWWRNACLLYFQQFSKRPFPESIEQPVGTLEYYQSLEFPYAPGIRPEW